MTNTNRLRAAILIAMVVSFWPQGFGTSPAAAADKQNSASQLTLPSRKQWQDVKKVQAETWRIQLRLDMPDLDPQAVQYAIFDHDPAPEYSAKIKRMRKLNLQQLKNTDTKSWKELVTYCQMKVDWDNCFAKLSAVEVNLLTNRGTTLGSNAPAGKKWVVTKCVDINSRPYCWSIPVEVTIGKQVSVTLDKHNTFDLQTPYNAAMNAP